MANKRQVNRLKKGSEVWNRWRKENPDVAIDLNFAYLSKANLSAADLSGADLSYANLSKVNLSKANLRNAEIYYANLSAADLSEADLAETTLSAADLSGADLNFANLSEANLNAANLRKADLSKANLRNADLSFTNLSAANLRKADLSDTNLSAAQVLGTNFREATFTGACIADWQIGSSTILKEVKCDYIFRTYDEENKQSAGRLPVDPDNTFAPGEFTQRFQIIASALETIDITFTEGIDWQAFFQSFQELRNNRPNEDINIQGMERKGDTFVVRLEVEAEVDKAAVETEVKQLYANQLAALEARYEEQLRLQSEEIAHHRQAQSSLLHIVQTMAEKDSITQNFHGPVGNVAGTNQGNMEAIQHIYAPEQQDLSEAAKEIQALLNALAETYNTTTEAGQEKLMKELGQEVEKHPKWQRALKEGGVELMKLLFPPISIPWEMAMVYLEDEQG